MQDKILLGFLMEGPKTGYDIKKAMEVSTDLFFNTSSGSIYPAFQKLLREGFATKKETTEGGRAKVTYTITSAGKKIFLEWINDKLPIDKIKQESLLRSFFFSQLSENSQKELFNDFIIDLKNRKAELVELQEKLSKYKCDFFQLSTLRFGIDYFEFMIKWHQKFMKNLDVEKE